MSDWKGKRRERHEVIEDIYPWLRCDVCESECDREKQCRCCLEWRLEVCIEANMNLDRRVLELQAEVAEAKWRNREAQAILRNWNPRNMGDSLTLTHAVEMLDGTIPYRGGTT